MFKLFFNIMYTISCLSDKAAKQRESEGREKQFSIAVSSITYAVLAVVFAAAGSYLFKWLVSLENIVIWILFGALSFGLLLGALALLFHAFLRVYYQFSVNSSVFSWIALIVFIASIAGSGAMVWLFLG